MSPRYKKIAQKSPIFCRHSDNTFGMTGSKVIVPDQGENFVLTVLKTQGGDRYQFRCSIRHLVETHDEKHDGLTLNK